MRLCAFLLGVFLSVGASAGTLASIPDLLRAYDGIAKAMAKEDFKTANVLAAKLLKMSEPLARDPSHDTLVLRFQKIYKACLAMSRTTKKEDLRGVFPYLSRAAVRMLHETQIQHANWQLFQCSNPKAIFDYWVQPVGEAMANPYRGPSEAPCGEKKTWPEFQG